MSVKVTILVLSSYVSHVSRDVYYSLKILLLYFTTSSSGRNLSVFGPELKGTVIRNEYTDTFLINRRILQKNKQTNF